MSDQEFDVLDELYFVQSFDEVRELTGMDNESLKEVLQELLSKGWIRCMESRDGVVDGRRTDFQKNYRQYFYLATKPGLLAHNSR